jgi:hypothetical protein
MLNSVSCDSLIICWFVGSFASLLYFLQCTYLHYPCSVSWPPYSRLIMLRWQLLVLLYYFSYYLVASLSTNVRLTLFVNLIIKESIERTNWDMLLIAASMPVWLKWGLWVSPLTYGEIGLFVNEFLAPRWQKVSVSWHGLLVPYPLYDKSWDADI